MEGSVCSSGSDPTDDFPFKFGDIQTADVVLRLESMEGEQYTLLHVHSHALCQSEYFKARLSERWASNDDKHPLQLTLDRCKTLRISVKCMELMYVPKQYLHCSFGSVKEAVSVLEVAAQLLFHACITACMHYLEFAALSIEEEELIRSCISTFHLTPTLDLAAKLSIPDKPADMMKDIIDSLAWYGVKDVADKLMEENVEPIFFPAFGTLNDVIVLEGLRRSRDVLKADLEYWVMEEDELQVQASHLEWILNQLDKCQVAEEAFQMLADDQDLVDGISRSLFSVEQFSSIMNGMFGVLQNGKVIVSLEVRVALLSKWLPIIARRKGGFSYMHLNSDLLCNVVKSLPMINQKMIFKVWIESWCKRILEASYLEWLLTQLIKCQVAENAIEILADNKDLVNGIRLRKMSGEVVSFFVNYMFGTLQNGKVMVPIAVRVDLLRTWLPVFARQDCKILKGELVCNVVKSLPMINQKMIFKVWIEASCRLGILEEAFHCWCGKLRRTRKDRNVQPSNPEPTELVRK